MKKTPSKLAKIIEKTEWNTLVKLRAGNKCELCSKSQDQLHAHHIFRKQSNYMRVLLENGICLCAGCHMNGIHSPDWKTQKEFNEKILKCKGQELMDQLLYLRCQAPKITLQQLEDLRKEYKEEIKKPPKLSI